MYEQTDKIRQRGTHPPILPLHFSSLIDKSKATFTVNKWIWLFTDGIVLLRSLPRLDLPRMHAWNNYRRDVPHYATRGKVCMELRVRTLHYRALCMSQELVKLSHLISYELTGAQN